MIKKTYKGPQFKDERKILHEVTKGLAYLHGLEVVHGDIKPSNIFIFVSELGKMTVKLADFGLYIVLIEDQRHFMDSKITERNRTSGWMAPEVIHQYDQFTFKADIFPIGCIFAYTLSGGKHPFGEDAYAIFIRIVKQEPMLLKRHDLKEPYSNNSIAFDLITTMVKMNASKRPTAEEVLHHPFFNHRNWKEEESSTGIS